MNEYVYLTMTITRMYTLHFFILDCYIAYICVII